MSASYMSFPSNLDTSKPAIMFSAEVWDYTKIKTSEIASTNKKFAETAGAVVMYLPPFSESSKNRYEDITAGSGIGAAAVSSTLGAFADFMTAGNSAIVANLIRAKKGLSLSKDAVMTFSDVEFKSYTFNFTMIPTDPSDSTNIQEIINFFKSHMRPTIDHLIFYKMPSVFKINTFNVGQNDGLFNFRYMGLEEISIDWGEGFSDASAMIIMDDNAPSIVKMSLTFTELSKWINDGKESSNSDYTAAGVKEANDIRDNTR